MPSDSAPTPAREALAQVVAEMREAAAQWREAYPGKTYKGVMARGNFANWLDFFAGRLAVLSLPETPSVPTQAIEAPAYYHKNGCEKRSPHMILAPRPSWPADAEPIWRPRVDGDRPHVCTCGLDAALTSLLAERTGRETHESTDEQDARGVESGSANSPTGSTAAGNQTAASDSRRS